MATILVIEDEDSIRSLIKITLNIDNHTVLEASDGEEGLAIFNEAKKNKNLPDLILLDIMLPKISGYEILEKLKEELIPIIFLTAKSSTQDKVLGLKLGAYDYLSKPFEPLELLARVEAAIRTRNAYLSQEKPKKEPEIDYQNIRIFPTERKVLANNKEINLTVKEYDLLYLFITNVGQVYTREQLVNQVWGYDYLGNSRTVDMHVKQLRKKLPLKDALETVYKVGYKLNYIDEN